MRFGTGFGADVLMAFASGGDSSAPEAPVLTSPSDSDTLYIGQTVTVSATTSDSDLDRIEFRDELGNVLATDASSPYSTTFVNALSAGAHQIVAVAIRGGQETESDPIDVTSVALTLVFDTLFSGATWNRPSGLYSPSNVAGNAYGDALGSGAGGVQTVGSGGGGARVGGEFTPGATETVTVPGATTAANDGADCSIGTHLIAKGGLKSAPGVAGAGGTAAASTAPGGGRKKSGGNGTLGAGSVNSGGAAGNVGDASTLTGGTTNGGYGGVGTGNYPGVGGGSQAAFQGAGGRAEAWIAYRVPATAGYPRLEATGWARATANGTSLAVSFVDPFNGDAVSFAGKTISVVVASDGNPTISEASGDWTQLAQVSLSTTLTLTVFSIHNAVGTETLTISTGAASEKVAYQFFVFSDCGGLPSWTTGTGTSNAPNPPTLGSLSLGKYAVVAIAALDGGLARIDAGPSGYGNVLSLPSASTDGVGLATALAYGEATSFDPGTFTAVNTPPWIAGTLVFPPLA